MCSQTRPERVYLDNAATSFPKPPEVLQAMNEFQTNYGASPGRGAYEESRRAAAMLDSCRTLLSEIVNAPFPHTISFAFNTTDALNTAIKGLLLPKLLEGLQVDAVVSDMEHNSILRPLHALAAFFPNNLNVVRVAADQVTGKVAPQDVEAACTQRTQLVAVNHASNVTGTVQPIRQIAEVCRERAVPFLVDAAQTAGHYPIDVQHDMIDLLAAPGHKGLLGPLGTGFLYIRDGFEQHIATSREGGTGSVSEHPVHPPNLPDKYEAGSHNTLGLIGLHAALQYIQARSVEAIHDHHMQLTSRFLNGLTDQSTGKITDGIRLLGPQENQDRIGVFSVTTDTFPPEKLAQKLESDFGILTRPGLHCAPYAHETFSTDPRSKKESGATRFSIGTFNTEADIDRATTALRLLCCNSNYSATTSVQH